MKLLIAIALSILVLNQDSDDEIKWSENRRLTWLDFQDICFGESSNSAVTAYAIPFSFTIFQDSIFFEISCVFYKSKSCVKIDEVSSYILNHEQGHFDIAEIYARKLRKALFEYSFSKNTTKEEIETLCRKFISEMEKFQDEYDKITRYSRDEDEQELWDQQIEVELKQLINFRNPNITKLLNP